MPKDDGIGPIANGIYTDNAWPQSKPCKFTFQDLEMIVKTEDPEAFQKWFAEWKVRRNNVVQHDQ